MSSIAYEQLLCNSKQFEHQRDEEEKDSKPFRDNKVSDDKTSGQGRDKSSQFVFNIWWTVFVAVIVATLGWWFV